MKKRTDEMKYWSRLARSISPYVPGEQPKIPDLIKLNTNENPYPPSPKVITAIQDCANAKLRLYPDPESLNLRTAIAKRHGVKPEQVFVGNGSDEVLALAFLAYFDPDRAVKMPDISYSFYPVYAQLYGLQTDYIDLTEEFDIPVEKFFGSEGGAILANPNAPTSKAIDLQAIRDICSQNDAPVIIDEAYAEFGEVSAIPLIGDYSNLLVVRTFSKSHSLAGLRVGYAIACAEMIEALRRIKDSFNSYPVDRIAQEAATAAIEDEKYCRNVINAIINTREKAIKRLADLGFSSLPSGANFIFATHESIAAEKLYKQLREHGILVRYFSKPRIDNYLRITVGTDDEMERLFFSLEHILKKW